MNTNVGEAARQLASQRRQVVGKCTVCGQPFTGTTKRRYCSEACRVRAHYWRQREKATQEKGVG
jgi:predicted nucleic acid-binding Zn ribbon protein